MVLLLIGLLLSSLRLVGLLLPILLLVGLLLPILLLVGFAFNWSFAVQFASGWVFLSSLLLVGLLLSSLLLVGFELTLTLSCNCCRPLAAAGAGQDKPVQLKLQCFLTFFTAVYCIAAGHWQQQEHRTNQSSCSALQWIMIISLQFIVLPVTGSRRRTNQSGCSALHEYHALQSILISTGSSSRRRRG